MVRQIDGRRYFLAITLTIIIFALGLLLGLVVEYKRSNYMQDTFQKHVIDLTSSQLQFDFIGSLDKTDICSGAYKVYYNSLEKLDESRIKLENYDDQAMDKSDFDLLQRQYLLEEVKYWLFARKTKELCKNDIVTILYFFHDEKTCPNCDEQSFILSYLKKILGDRLLIFSFNSKYSEEPMIPILLTTYGINQYPSLVINDEVVNMTYKDALLKKICDLYDKKPEACS